MLVAGLRTEMLIFAYSMATEGFVKPGRERRERVFCNTRVLLLAKNSLNLLSMLIILGGPDPDVKMSRPRPHGTNRTGVVVRRRVPNAGYVWDGDETMGNRHRAKCLEDVTATIVLRAMPQCLQFSPNHDDGAGRIHSPAFICPKLYLRPSFE